MTNVDNFSNIESNNLLIIIVCSILFGLILACAIVCIVLKVKKIKKNKLSEQEKQCLDKLEQDNKTGELYKNLILDKEIAKYKKLQEKYKIKLEKDLGLTKQQKNQDYKIILNEELEDYKKSQLLIIDKEVNKYKNEILKKVVLNTMQPLHLKVLNESSVAYVPINEEIKSRVIGKKGQNIKYLNEVTNSNMNLDKTGKFIEISCPNPYDRAIAINTLKHLIKSEAFDFNGIENIYKKEKKLIDKDCIETGKQYINKLGITIPNESIYSYVGRLKYRWSFSQNVLQHCYEVALICEQLANEFGLDPIVAKRVGFFHDIGKAIDYEKKYDHISSGIKIAKECDLDQLVIETILKHHRSKCNDDYVLLVRTADAWSAARTGARHNPNEEHEHTVQLLQVKISKLPRVQSVKIEMIGNVFYISFLPIINNKSTYLSLKFEIIKSIKKDVRFNKFKYKFIDESII